MNKRVGMVALQSVLIVALAALIAFSPAVGGKQAVKADTTTTLPTVNVNGTGKITVKPNIAHVSFGVFTHNDKSGVAQAENDALMAKIAAALKAAGVKEEDIQTTGYSLQPHYTWDRETEKSVLDGYDMNHTMSVTVRAIKDAGKIVGIIADNGANTVNGISFDVDDATLEQTKLAALNLAMANARAKAGVVAKAAGRTILSVQTVTVNDYSNVIRYDYKMAPSAEASGAAAPVEAGSLDISVDVSVTYLF